MINIKIHFSVYLLIVLSLFVSSLKSVFIYLSIILIHEIFHIIASLIYKVKPTLIELTIIGGCVHIPFEKLKPSSQILISLSGVFSNILMIIFSYLYDFPRYVINYNYILILFSLLPIYPLDGFNIMNSLLFLFIKNYKKSIKLLMIINNISLLLFIIASIFFNIKFLILISFFLVYKTVLLMKNYDYFYLKNLYNYKLSSLLK